MCHLGKPLSIKCQRSSATVPCTTFKFYTNCKIYWKRGHKYRLLALNLRFWCTASSSPYIWTGTRRAHWCSSWPGYLRRGSSYLGSYGENELVFFLYRQSKMAENWTPIRENKITSLRKLCELKVLKSLETIYFRNIENCLLRNEARPVNQSTKNNFY